MNFLNKAQVIGNVTRDPEVKQTQNGQSVVTIGVATNRKWKDKNTGEYKEDVEFHNIVCWGKLAEITGDYVKKGTKIFFEGRLQTRTWEDEAGAKHYRTEIVAQDMIILSRSDSANSETAPETATPTEESFTGEDLPF